MNETNNPETKYNDYDDQAPRDMIFIDHGADESRQQDDARFPQDRDVRFRLNTFDGANFQPLKLTWKTRLMLAAVGVVVLVLVVSFAITAFIILLIFAVIGAIAFGLKRLGDSLSR